MEQIPSYNALIEKSIIDEEKPSLFHITTKYKWVLVLSILMAAAEGILVYATVMGAVAAEVWQVALWGVGLLLAVYAIVKKSMAATLFNLVLLVGISLIPMISNTRSLSSSMPDTMTMRSTTHTRSLSLISSAPAPITRRVMLTI